MVHYRTLLECCTSTLQVSYTYEVLRKQVCMHPARVHGADVVGWYGKKTQSWDTPKGWGSTLRPPLHSSASYLIINQSLAQESDDFGSGRLIDTRLQGVFTLRLTDWSEILFPWMRYSCLHGWSSSCWIFLFLTDTFDSPPPPMGTQPPVESSRIIT